MCSLRLSQTGEARIGRVGVRPREHSTRATDSPDGLQMGDLKLGLDRRRVMAPGIEMQFRPKEFGLLVALAMQPCRVFSRQVLLDMGL